MTPTEATIAALGSIPVATVAVWSLARLALWFDARQRERR